MQKKQVAILDVGSSKVTAVVGERGINETFVIKGRYSFDYDGFSDGLFFNVDQLNAVVSRAVETLKSVTRNGVHTLYVGVPGAFTQVVVRDGQVSFSSKKKIREEEIDLLYDSAFVMQSGNYTLINRSAIVYELDDFRRLANPIGETSEILKGKLSFIFCKNYFIDAISSAITNNGIDNIEWISTSLAQSMYLLDGETRDRLAIVADVGYISTTLFIIQGDGILYQNSFDYGGGYITASLSEKFSLEFKDAEKLKRKVNLCVKASTGTYEILDCENGEYYNAEDVNLTIFASLDELCEKISEILDNSGYILPEYVPLMITGGGISYLRGAKEHVANRLGMTVEKLSPRVPMMDKPTDSSVLSLLDMALGQ